MAAVARMIRGSRVESAKQKGTNPNTPKKTKVTPQGRPTKGRS